MSVGEMVVELGTERSVPTCVVCRDTPPLAALRASLLDRYGPLVASAFAGFAETTPGVFFAWLE